MKAAYCEIKRGRNCVTVNYYSKEGYGLELGCRKLERERREAYAAKRRRLNRIRENIGAGVGIVGGIMSALGLGFLGWIFYNWVIVRYAIYGLILFRVGRCVWSIIKAETIAEENARHNMKLKNRSGRAENILGS